MAPGKPPLAPRLVLLLLGVLVLVLARTAAALGTLTDDDLRRIPSGGPDFDIHSGRLLAPILIPRVPGTPGIAAAQQHFVSFFRDELPAWDVRWQNSTARTPATGDRDVPFANLIFRRDPPGAAEGDVARLTLVAHYDSKREPEGFVGATDSAAPCAMLMHVARSLEEALRAKWAAAGEGGGGHDDDLEEGAVGVQILLLDGEEAFVRWTDEDSLYGARSLAEHWESEFHESMSAFRTPLDSISLFVLLDLLGAPDPTISSFFLPTHWAYRSIAALEARMRALGLLEAQPRAPVFPDVDKPAGRFGRGFVEDDHIPFMRRGVDVLHLIPTPFPPVWHRMDDDGEHLDLAVVRDWARIVTAFAAQWMDLSGHLPALAPEPANPKPPSPSFATSSPAGDNDDENDESSHSKTMRLSIASAALALACVVHASSWGFADGSVTVSTRDGGKTVEPLKETGSLKTALSLGHEDKLRVWLTTTEGSKAKRPHQAFLMIREPSSGLEAPFPLTLKPSGKGAVDITQKDLPVQLLRAREPLEVSLVLGSFGASQGLVARLFDLAPRLDAGAQAASYEAPLRYGRLPEIHHIFRADPSNPPKIVSVAFAAAVAAAVPSLFVGWFLLGGNMSHLPKALGAAPISHPVFFGSILAMEGVFFMYYTQWNLFHALPVMGLVAAVALLSGTKALGEVQSRRLAGER
ncbi:Glutaminyl-peptide cyclotransferase [Escovopsis weberi]|uniref:Peptide hydrolase n=1 Tax=Escovopsis weberi TaxID=150374 RepID=A0A0M9VW46_ESCWE|nr:Glutaminyl-peptide cyclotransferase [Escovopsis weberi]